MKFSFGLIPGIINEDIKADFFGTLEKVAAIGYECIEGAGRLTEGDADAVAATRARLDGMGLAVSGIGASRELIEKDLGRLVEKAGILGAGYIVLYWAPCESREQLVRDAALYERVAVSCAEHGLAFCYHNHDHEFTTTFDGAYALDVLADSAPHLSLQVDVAWVAYGGAAPGAYLRKRAGRVPVIHLKDIADLETRGTFTAVGTGCIDVAACVNAAVDSGARWVIVEQDRPRNLSGMDSVRASYLNVKELGLLANR